MTSDGSASLPDVLAAVTLGPEDRLVLAFPLKAARYGAGMSRMLAERGLADRVVLTFGAEDSIVLRATKAEGSTVGQCGECTDWLYPPMRLWCHLAYGHTGMHSDGEATWSNDPPIRLQPEAKS